MDLLLPLLLVALLIPMFLGVRRQKREMAKVTEMQDNLKVGDRVITTSGLYGTVVETDDSSVDLEIAEDVVTTWSRAAIREVRNDDAETSTAGISEEAVDDSVPGTTEAPATPAASAESTGDAAGDAPRLTKD
ncbi:preprotein translocase subunit YajC [Nocardia sp. 2]|uniref:Preprotein translocase subunit YajC n=1 Tax=Nocardia acididurans TaxID=2802282 RepID=A0ABS1M8W4_9NOCA|nr:preprotein translocase subunit YajC [Nocardia acididurans]MBL1076731.1 preprotein translocase subunit YajC [Nocardia acididurans]